MSDLNPRFVTRPPTQEQLGKVTAAVFADGGRRLSEPHIAREFEFKLTRRKPDGTLQTFPNGAPMPPKIIKASSAGCGQAAQLVVPYQEPETFDRDGMAVVCVIDDAMHLWPRFRSEGQPA